MCAPIRLCLVAQSCLPLWDSKDCSPPGSSVHGDSPGKNTGVGCHALLHLVFPNKNLLIPVVGLVCPKASLFHSTQHSPGGLMGSRLYNNVYWHGSFWCTGMCDKKMVKVYSPHGQQSPQSLIRSVFHEVQRTTEMASYCRHSNSTQSSNFFLLTLGMKCNTSNRHNREIFTIKHNTSSTCILR